MRPLRRGLAAPLKHQSDSMRVAIVGRGRGRDHISAWMDEPKFPSPHSATSTKACYRNTTRQIESCGKPAPAAVADFRRLLEDRSIDVVSVASPNHHDALQTIWACQAGKDEDVYVEKPCSHTIHEGNGTTATARLEARGSMRST